MILRKRSIYRFHYTRSIYGTEFLVRTILIQFSAKMSAVADAVNQFAIDLHKVLRTQKELYGKNLFYSPASICIAIGMVYNGAQGSTADQIAKVFHWDEMKLEFLNQEMKKFNSILSSANTASNQLSTANKLYLQEGFEVLQSFQDTCKEYFEAETLWVDYKRDCEGSRRIINYWVEQKTKKKIQDLVPPGSLNARSRATLVNAIYFKGLWQKQFNKEHTFPSKFFLRENQECDVQMMFQKSKFKVTEIRNLDYQMLEMPYKGRDLSMILILPNKIEGLFSLEDKLSFEGLNQAVQSLTNTRPIEVEVSMPKFSMNREIELTEILQSMGMENMFDEFEANFRGITHSPEKLFVSDVFHQAFVDVNEEGTEASAATAVVMNTRMFMKPVPCFTVDHPFLLMITHRESGAILFLGRVTNPSIDSDQWYSL